MSLEALRVALTTAFRDGFKNGAGVAPFPVRYANQPFQQPAAATWGSFSVATGERDYSAIGSRELRTMGVAYLQVFTVEEKGTADATKAADLVAGFFDGQTIAAGAGGTVLMRVTSARTVGRTTGGWYQVNVETPFQYDENE